MKLNWYLMNCGVKVCVHDDLIVLKSHHKLISSSWCLWPEKKISLKKNSNSILFVSYLAVRFSNWQALYPLLCIGAVFGFQDESAIISKDLESLGDATSAFFGHFYRPYWAHV